MKKQIVAVAILITIVIALGIGGTLVYLKYRSEKEEAKRADAEAGTIEDVLSDQEEEKSALEEDIRTLEEQINAIEENN